MRRIILAAFVAVAARFVVAPTASAHHTTVTCVSPGTWRVVNSENDTAMSFTSPQGPAGSIGPNDDGGGPNGETTVSFSGDSLTVNGTWTNGQTASNSGTGDCTEQTTTTEETTTTSTTTTTLPCEFNPELPPDDPGCQETTTTTPETTTTSTTSTTSTTTTTTTTAPPITTPSVLSITAISPICLRDAPYIDVTFGNQPVFNGRPATVTFVAVNGQVVGTNVATYQAGTTVRFVYPGAQVDAAGNPLDWPGWVFDGDDWVVDPTDAFLREGMTVFVEVNPTASDTVSYPPATPLCTADPPQTSSVGGQLPATR